MTDCVNTRLTRGFVRKIKENWSYPINNKRVALAQKSFVILLKFFPIKDFINELVSLEIMFLWGGFA